LACHIGLGDLQKDPRLPAGLEFVVYGSIGDFRLYSFPMKAKLNAPFKEWAGQIGSVSVAAAVNAALAF
jgi:hypothetical protein